VLQYTEHNNSSKPQQTTTTEPTPYNPEVVDLDRLEHHNREDEQAFASNMAYPFCDVMILMTSYFNTCRNNFNQYIELVFLLQICFDTYMLDIGITQKTYTST
jgi:hypothetical protein